MKEKELVINYVEYDSMDEMPAAERELMEQAMKATATKVNNFFINFKILLVN